MKKENPQKNQPLYIATLTEGSYVENKYEEGEIGGATYYSINIIGEGKTIIEAIKNSISKCFNIEFEQDDLYNMGNGDIRYDFMRGVDKNDFFFTMDEQDIEDWKKGKIRAVAETIHIKVNKVYNISDKELTKAGVRLY